MRLRTPALRPLMPAPAAALATDPAPLVEAHFRAVWASSMHDLPFVNPALAVEAVGFQRLDGDWLGVVITPWFINLFLLPGGGRRWQELPTGEHRRLGLPVGEMEFIADNPGPESVLPAYQYCPLLAPVQQVVDQEQARQIAAEMLATVLAPPAPAGPPVAAMASPAADVTPPPADVASPARRGFLRGGFGSAR
jgi:[NiFe] hydrogenase assembly HybE family chaperone